MPQETIYPLKQFERLTTARTPQNIQLVKDIVEANLKASVRWIAQQVGICLRLAHTILKKHMSLKPYQIQVVQKLELQDCEKRKQFASWFINQCELNHNFTGKIIMSNETHFYIDGSFNKQNCRFWAEHNPQVVQPTHLHSKRIIVWRAITAQEIIGPYFFEDHSGNAVTVNAERYL